MRVRAVVGVGLAIGLAVGGCSTPQPSPSPSSAGPASAEILVLQKPWLPPWAGPGTPPEIAERAGLRFCGVEEGPPIDRSIRQCFVDAVIAGRDIEFARIESTIEGDPIATVFGYEPPAGFTILVDSTQDRFGVGGWSVTVCSQIVPDPADGFSLDGCMDGPGFR